VTVHFLFPLFVRSHHLVHCEGHGRKMGNEMGNICSRGEPICKRKDERVEVQDDILRLERSGMEAEGRVGAGRATTYRGTGISDRATATPRSGRVGGITMGGAEAVETAEWQRERRRN